VELFVGVGASRVRDLFEKAKAKAPCIIFIDEIDAVGRQRGSGLGGGNDEREQTINQLLTEMDGFEGNTGVIVLAATNRPDVLDQALLRPGRFDRQVGLGLRGGGWGWMSLGAGWKRLWVLRAAAGRARAGQRRNGPLRTALGVPSLWLLWRCCPPGAPRLPRSPLCFEPPRPSLTHAPPHRGRLPAPSPQVTVDRPDVQGRVAILKVHARGKALGKDVDLDKVARRTPGFTGADLQNLMNEAAILAARRGLQEISKDEIADALERIIAGPEKKGAVMSDKKRRLVAYHEAGHALVGALMPDYDPVTKISIVPRGAAGGLTFFAPSEERLESGLYSRTYFENQMAVALGGRVAEELIFGEDDITTGASGDFQQVTRTARLMVTQLGFSKKLGQVAWSSGGGNAFLGQSMAQPSDFSSQVQHGRGEGGGPNPGVTGVRCDHLQSACCRACRLLVPPGPVLLRWASQLVTPARPHPAHPPPRPPQTADEIDQEVKALVETAYRRAKDLVTSNIEILHKVAGVLIEKVRGRGWGWGQGRQLARRRHAPATSCLDPQNTSYPCPSRSLPLTLPLLHPCHR
jgi:ATP-dependent Zn protease